MYTVLQGGTIRQYNFPPCDLIQTKRIYGRFSDFPKKRLGQERSFRNVKVSSFMLSFQIRPYLQTNQGRASNSNPKCQRNRRWRGKRRITPLVWGHTSSYDDASEAFNVSFESLKNNYMIYYEQEIHLCKAHVKTDTFQNRHLNSLK